MFARTVLAPSATLFDLYKASKDVTGEALCCPTKRCVVEDVSAEQYINNYSETLLSVDADALLPFDVPPMPENQLGLVDDLAYYEGTIELGYLLFVVGPTLWETPLEFLLHVQSGGVSAETVNRQFGALCQRWEEAMMRDDLSDWTEVIRTSPVL